MTRNPRFSLNRNLQELEKRPSHRRSLLTSKRRRITFVHEPFKTEPSTALRLTDWSTAAPIVRSSLFLFGFSSPLLPPNVSFCLDVCPYLSV